MSTANQNHSRSAEKQICIGGGGAFPAAEMLRFVKGPDGGIYLDVHQKLKQSAVYLCPTVAAVEAALETNTLNKALGAAPIADAAFFKQSLCLLLLKSFFDRLGLGRKAGQVVLGSSKALEAAAGGHARGLFHSTDAGDDTRSRLENIAKKYAIPLHPCGSKQQWGQAFAKENVTVAAVTEANAAAALGVLSAAVAAFKS